MTALAGDRFDQARSEPGLRNFANMAAAVTIYAGAMVAMDTSGNCRPARATATDKVVGVALKRCDNSAGLAGAFAGGVEVDTRFIHRFGNSSSTDAITDVHVGRDCFVVDDQTVALTDNGGTRPRAGRIEKVDSKGVWVDFSGKRSRKAIVGPLAMTDVSAAGNSAEGCAPFAGIVTKMYTKLGGAITGADSTVTGKINGSAMTGGAVTVAYSGSAAGDLDFAYPTAANVVAAGDKLIAASDGASSTTATLEVYFEIEAV